MVNSIPFDQGLALGNILLPEKVKALQMIAEAQKPCDILNDQLNALITQNYKIRMIYSQMISMKVSEDALSKIADNVRELKKDMIQTAIKLAYATIKTEDDIMALKLAAAQTTIAKNIESPINYGVSKVDHFPLSFDSIKFDVQYYRNEKNEDEQNAHASSLTQRIGASFEEMGTTMSSGMAHSVNRTSINQTSNHSIEGTIVISAHCTHKQADIIDPFVIDPIKGVTAWNYTFPDDRLKVDPVSIIQAAIPDGEEGEDDPEKENAIHLLSGCSKGSSFVGFVHILQVENTSSSQTAASVAAAIQADLAVASFSGSFGVSSSSGSTAKNLMSTSELSTQCSIVCEGSIPNIATEQVTTATMKMKQDPKEIMGNLSAIMGASDSNVNDSLEVQASDGKRGAQFSQRKSEHLKNTVTNLERVEIENNQVLNTNSMLTAFTDFCKEAVSGEGGIPINFFIKRLTKADVAREYIAKFYPNGASGKQGIRGQLGQEELKDGEGEET